MQNNSNLKLQTFQPIKDIEKMSEVNFTMVELLYWSFILTPKHLPSPLEEAINDILTRWVQQLSLNEKSQAKETFIYLFKEILSERTYLKEYGKVAFLDKVLIWLDYHCGYDTNSNIYTVIKNAVDEL